MIQMQPGLKTTTLDKMMKPEYVKKKKEKTAGEGRRRGERGNGRGKEEYQFCDNCLYHLLFFPYLHVLYISVQIKIFETYT